MTYPNSNWVAELAGLSIAAMDRNPILGQELAWLSMDMAGLHDASLRAEAMSKLCQLAMLFHSSTSAGDGAACATYAMDWMTWMNGLPRVVLN